MTYDAMQVPGTQPALDTTAALPTASSHTLPHHVQVLQDHISRPSTESKVPDLKLCLKKVEYAMKRGEREHRP